MLEKHFFLSQIIWKVTNPSQQTCSTSPLANMLIIYVSFFLSIHRQYQARSPPSTWVVVCMFFTKIIFLFFSPSPSVLKSTTCVTCSTTNAKGSNDSSPNTPSRDQQIFRTPKLRQTPLVFQSLRQTQPSPWLLQISKKWEIHKTIPINLMLGDLKIYFFFEFLEMQIN